MERIGLIITFLWSLLIGSLIYIKWPEAKIMSLNEWGDFLAGITAPIAFLWLIIGYGLQRKELSLNTEALTNQAKELKAQTEYLKVSANAAVQQADIADSKYLREQLFGDFKS